MRGARAAYWEATPYVDAHGETGGPRRFRGRPLFLDPRRWRRVARLWERHEVAAEVTRLRNGAVSVVRMSFY